MHIVLNIYVYVMYFISHIVFLIYHLLSILSVKIYMVNIYVLFTLWYLFLVVLVYEQDTGVCKYYRWNVCRCVNNQPLFSTFRNCLCFATLCSNLTKMCAVSGCGDNICAGRYCSRRLSPLVNSFLVKRMITARYFKNEFY